MCFKPYMKGAINEFSSSFGERKEEKNERNDQITTGTNFAKDTGVSVEKKVEMANTLHKIS